MEGSRREIITIEKFLKRSWPILALGALLLIGASALLFTFAVSGKARKSDAAVTAASQIAAPTSTSGLVPRALDGMLVGVEDSQLQPYALIVENHTDARPLAGPSAASLVFEIPVEGGITRNLLVFDATTTAEAIGPVRSARPYFVDFADGLNAVFGHVGGSPESLDKISKMPALRDLNEYFNGRYYWRSVKREAPHNVYTRTDLLHEAATDKKWATGHFRSWTFKDDDPPDSATGSVRGDLAGPKVMYGGSYNANWVYDKKTDAYRRFESGRQQSDQDGTAVTAKNVVVMKTDGSVLDAVGRLKIRTTGKGQAALYRDGKKFELTWQRAAGEHIRFESVDGLEAMFNRGTTWIEVVIDPAIYGAINGTPVTASSTTSTK
jgi:hypothetical protein